jgi:hypothetical protein
MNVSLRRAVVLSLVVASAFAAQSITATANILPSNTPIVATNTTNATFGYSGITITCRTATVSGTTPALGVSALSVTLAYRNCAASGAAVNVICRGRMTMRLTTFTSPSGTGTVTLDSDFDCTFDIPSAGCRISVVGPQANVGTFDFTNTNQILRFTLNAVTGTDTGGVCAGSTVARTGRGTAIYTSNDMPGVRIVVS